MARGGRLKIISQSIRGKAKGAKPTFVRIEIQDTGEGMTDEQRTRAFTSVLNTTKRRGTGLGLAIVGRVIETHRGKIRIKSRVGRGTTVSILLPV
jgi:two-component system, NtrC family, sensor histidine kinase HydH